jgi:hypothetical protein
VCKWKIEWMTDSNWKWLKTALATADGMRPTGSLVQNKGRAMTPPDKAQRALAWERLGKAEVCDCLEFHSQISDLSWHSEHPRLQRTWRPLILLLKAFLNEPSDIEDLRAYQRDRWGRVKLGETCVIELSGLAAKSARVPIDRERFRHERGEIIRERMLRSKPVFVVMYRINEKPYWEEIAGSPVIRDGVVQVGPTMIAFAPHPQDHGRRNDDWTKLGEMLRKESGRP